MRLLADLHICKCGLWFSRDTFLSSHPALWIVSGFKLKLCTLPTHTKTTFSLQNKLSKTKGFWNGSTAFAELYSSRVIPHLKSCPISFSCTHSQLHSLLGITYVEHPPPTKPPQHKYTHTSIKLSDVFDLVCLVSEEGWYVMGEGCLFFASLV